MGVFLFSHVLGPDDASPGIKQIETRIIERMLDLEETHTLSF